MTEEQPDLEAIMLVFKQVIDSSTPDECRLLSAAFAHLQSAIQIRLYQSQADAPRPTSTPGEPGKYLTVPEVCERGGYRAGVLNHQTVVRQQNVQ